MDRTHDDGALSDLLSSPRRIAMVGASPKEDRDSNRVFRFLLEEGHDVLPVNPVVPEVAGVACVPDLQAAVDYWGAPPDVVDVFRAPDAVPAIVEETLRIGAPWLWLQFGVVHEAGIQAALDRGLEVVVDRCIKVETKRLQAP